jgi:GT2 family glycosyltransferase
VFPIFEQDPGAKEKIARKLYARALNDARHADVGAKFNYLSSANFCIRADVCRGVGMFDPRFNHTGGEDTDLFRRLLHAGRKLVWAPEAKVNEYVPASRTTFPAMAERRFAQGQMRTFSHLASPPKRTGRAAFWMVAGATQYIGHSLLAAANAASGRPGDAEMHRIQAQGGLGKVLWQSRFRKNRYGKNQ